MDTEQILIQKAQKGDHDAFAALVDEHQRYVYNLALRVVKDENEALDLTQETFVRAWTALPNFKGQSQFRTWLYRIVTNLCYNRLPGLQRDLSEMGDDYLDNALCDEVLNINPADSLEAEERRELLHREIARLPECYRLLITLRYQQELAYDEIASVVNLPHGTVKTGLFRAKERLRQALQVFEEELLCTP